MKNQQTWEGRISETLKRFGFEGEVNIEGFPDYDEYLIYHPAFKFPLTGYFSNDGSLFNVIMSEHFTQFPHEDFEVMFRETIVFDVVTFTPLYYSIYHEPETQRVMMSDYGKFKSGDILYKNNCAHGRYVERILDKLIFTSEVVDIIPLLPTD